MLKACICHLLSWLNEDDKDIHYPRSTYFIQHKDKVLKIKADSQQDAVKRAYHKLSKKQPILMVDLSIVN